jgi:hypothetical protein
MYHVYDNALSISTVTSISKHFLYPSFPWYINHTCEKTLSDRYADKYPNFDNSIQLYHPFLSYTQIWRDLAIDYYYVDNWDVAKKEKELINSIIKEFLQFIGEDYNDVIIYRAKSNLMIKSHQTTPNPPHIDLVDIKHKVFLYYVNDSDGDTIIYEDKNAEKIVSTISPKLGRILFFDGQHYHSSSPPKINNKRIVINIDLVNRRDLPGVSV